jgi:DNA-binding PadR family transcriptional regulator
VNNRIVVSTIVETLGRNGALTIEELLKNVSKLHNDVDERYLNETLMTMELHGLVSVYQMTRGKRRVELTKG